MSIAHGIESPIEAEIVADLAYFEAKLQEAPCDHESDPSSARGYHQPFVTRRRQLLAALRDGRPKAWRDYSA